MKTTVSARERERERKKKFAMPYNRKIDKLNERGREREKVRGENNFLFLLPFKLSTKQNQQEFEIKLAS